MQSVKFENHTLITFLKTNLGQTIKISKTENPQGFEESKIVARDGENIAGNALREGRANWTKCDEQ